MRRLLATAAIAAAGLGALPSAPASASWQCVTAPKGSQHVGVCAGSWCPDMCFIVAWVECEGFSHRICGPIDGLGFPPGGGR